VSDAPLRLLPWQVALLRRVLTPGSTTPIAINGGIGVGKSHLLAYILGAVARTRPGSTSGLLSDSWPSLRENNLPYCRQVFGNAARWLASDRVFEFANGSRVELRHYDLAAGHDESRNPIEGRTYAGGVVILDEAQKVSQVAFKHMTGRARGEVADLNGHMWPTRVILCGRPNAGTWWWEGAAAEAGGIVVKPRTAENPHNGPDYLANLRRAYDEAMFRCITEGAPAPTVGGVFGDWSDKAAPAGNILDGFVYNPALPVHLGVDFGRRTPAVVWVQQQTIGGALCDVAFDEAAPDETLTPELALAMLAPWQRRWGARPTLYGAEPCRWRIDVAYVDPAGNAKNPQTGATDVGILRRQSDPGDGLGGGIGALVVTTTAADRVSVSAGLTKLRGAVCPGEGPRRLLMTRELWDRGMQAPAKERTLSRSLMQYAWKHAEAKAGGGSEHPSTHHVDALRYWYIGARWGIGAGGASAHIGGALLPRSGMVGVR
jgi:hypothetical protein